VTCLLLPFALFLVDSFPQRQVDGEVGGARRIVSVGPLLSQIFEDLKEIRSSIHQQPVRPRRPTLFFPFKPRTSETNPSTKNQNNPSSVSETVQPPPSRQFEPSQNKQAPSSVSETVQPPPSRQFEPSQNKQAPSNRETQPVENQKPSPNSKTEENEAIQSEIQRPQEAIDKEPQPALNKTEQDNDDQETTTETKNKRNKNRNRPGAGNKNHKTKNKNKTVPEDEQPVASIIGPPPSSVNGDGVEKVGNFTRKIINAPCTGGIARSGSCRESFD